MCSIIHCIIYHVLFIHLMYLQATNNDKECRELKSEMANVKDDYIDSRDTINR